MATMKAVEAYPLYWPDGWKRTPLYARKQSRFKASFTKSRDECVREITRLGGRDPIISTNVALRRDGLPLAGQRQPDDPGVAVYFTRKGTQQVLACDTYTSLEDNIHAVELTIAALRTLSRHGASTILDRAFQGFTALPPKSNERPWYDVLAISEDAELDVVERAYRQALTRTHPDRGGDVDAFNEAQSAWTEFRAVRNIPIR